MTNKKGMSDVVTTLIIILLVIAAIGIIWVVVKPFISGGAQQFDVCLLYTSPSPRDRTRSRMPSSA